MDEYDIRTLRGQSTRGRTRPGTISATHVQASTLLLRMRPKHKPGDLSLYKETIESLSLTGVTHVFSCDGYLRVVYDPLVVAVADLKEMLAAAYSAVHFGWYGRGATQAHTVQIAFGGSLGPDLPIASVLLGTTEKGLIRRLCRTTHLIRELAAPAASPLISTTACNGLASLVVSNRQHSVVETGTVTLSSSGIMIARCPWPSNELVIGCLSGTQPPVSRLFHVGDTVRFQPVSPTR